ncbi:hypothetical protein C1646_772072 [Rhizophagus diaphanus]|nr:hypothetical protein C1646_772072 [Rhizophagus diaphanus] [Rhizophagus sp. MUCL 43196]
MCNDAIPVIPYTPASISTTVAENGMVLLTDEIKKYDTAKLIEYLQGQKNLELSETAIKILEKEKLNGRNFFDITKKKYIQDGLVRGSAMRLIKFAKKCKKKKKRAFLTYRSLKEVLAKYSIDSNNIGTIRQFLPNLVQYESFYKLIKIGNVNQVKRSGKTSIISTGSLQQTQNESALKERSKEEKDLRKNVKRVMKVIIGLLKYRRHVLRAES